MWVSEPIQGLIGPTIRDPRAPPPAHFPPPLCNQRVTERGRRNIFIYTKLKTKFRVQLWGASIRRVLCNMGVVCLVAGIKGNIPLARNAHSSLPPFYNFTFFHTLNNFLSSRTPDTYFIIVVTRNLLATPVHSLPNKVDPCVSLSCSTFHHHLLLLSSPHHNPVSLLFTFKVLSYIRYCALFFRSFSGQGAGLLTL